MELLHHGGSGGPDLDMNMDQDQIRYWLTRINQFYTQVRWLADSFVLDFHTNSHWSTLHPSWQTYLQGLTPTELGAWMLGHDRSHKPAPASDGVCRVCPLGLQAFRALTSALSLDRNQVPVDKCLNLIIGLDPNPLRGNEKEMELQKLFHRKVKLKKRHEIGVMSKIVTACAENAGTRSALDIGAGLGHLSRYLTTCHGLELVCVDSEQEFVEAAKKLDTKLRGSVFKSQNKQRTPANGAPPSLSYVNKRLIFGEGIQMESDQENYGLIGLHTCGDLGPLILSSFVTSPSARFVTHVGCCYMKMTQNHDQGHAHAHAFPMSNFLQSELPDLRFSYEALEVACHSIENYADKLLAGRTADLDGFRVHNHRAVLELLMRNKYPKVAARAGMKSVRNVSTMTLEEYVKKATAGHASSTPIEFTSEELQAVVHKLDDWWLVICFYSLRLMLAKMIETAVILDRVLYLRENGKAKLVGPLPSEAEPRP